MLPSAMQNLKTLMLNPHAGLGIGVKAGFALLLLLLAGVTLVGITRMAESTASSTTSLRVIWSNKNWRFR